MRRTYRHTYGGYPRAGGSPVAASGRRKPPGDGLGSYLILDALILRDRDVLHRPTYRALPVWPSLGSLRSLRQGGCEGLRGAVVRHGGLHPASE